MLDLTIDKTDRIRELNDNFRRTFVGGAIVLTAGVAAVEEDSRSRLLAKIRAFEAFTEDNDPHQEHDFGQVDILGQEFFWKIDYYDRACEHGSPDAADPAVTTRMLTVMFSHEY